MKTSVWWRGCLATARYHSEVFLWIPYLVVVRGVFGCSRMRTTVGVEKMIVVQYFTEQI